MSLSAAERETIVRWSDDPEELMTVYTHRESQARKLLAAGATLKREGRSVDGEVHSWTLEMPREWFKWPKPKRKVSEAQRTRAAELGRRVQSERQKP